MARRHLNSGFTLVEVMIAVLFVSIALFGYIALQTRLIDSNERILLKQEAVLKAEQQMAVKIAATRRAATPGVTSVSATSKWTDRSGSHDYEVDGLAQAVLPGW